MVWSIIWPQLIVYAIVLVVWGSFFEWTLHRFIMHRNTPPFTYPFKLHALQHHVIFKADTTFHAVDEDAKEHVCFVPRDYLIILIANLPVYFAFEWITGLTIMIGAAIATLSYVAIFDILHYCFHVPETRFFENWGWFRWIKLHHLIHHKYQFRNLNVVFPLADVLFGTLMTKRKVKTAVLEF